MALEVEVKATQLRIQSELVDALERCPSLRGEAGREVMAGLLSEQFDAAIFPQGQSVRLQLLDLVRHCVKKSGGLLVLARVVGTLDPHAPEVAEIAELADEWAAARALPTRDWDRLREVLRSVRLADDPALERRKLRHLARVATEDRCDDLPPRSRTAWSTFLHLADHNTGPGALPPAMAFVGSLADRVEDRALAEDLLRWTWRWAEWFEVTDVLERARRRPGGEDGGPVDVFMIIEVDPDPADKRKFVLSHWEAWDGAGRPARRRGDARVDQQDLEAEVDRLIEELEIDLGTTSEALLTGSIVLEFMLPWEMLNVPVERWRKATMTTRAVPLAVDHPVVVRSLERTRARRFRLAWKQRWAHVTGRSAAAQPYWGDANGDGDFMRMAVDLRDGDGIVSMVLSEPPGDRRGRAWQETALAFRAGIPVIVWDREDCGSRRFRDAVVELFSDGAVDRLPHRVASLRREALRAADDPGHAGRSLAVLVDDPGRLPEHPTSWSGHRGVV